MQVNQFFLNGDMQGAIAYMRKHAEFKDVLPAYVAIFEHCEWENKILFLKLRKFRIPKQTRFKTLVLLLQPSMKPFDHGDIHGIEDLIRPVAIGLIQSRNSRRFIFSASSSHSASLCFPSEEDFEWITV